MKKIYLIFLSIYISVIFIFVFFSTGMRDFMSINVDVMSPVMHVFADGYFSPFVIYDECFYSTEEGTTYSYIIELRDENADKAWFIKRIEVIKGLTDGIYTEILYSPVYNAIFVCGASHDITDNARVVISRVVN